MNCIQTYVQTQSLGTITEPVNGSWIQAYAEYIGLVAPVNESWLQAICEEFGITAPLYGSWTIALADYYNITNPDATWWCAISQAPYVPPGGIPPFIWNLNTREWELETRVWATAAAADADATAYIDEVLLQGGTLSVGLQSAINDFYVGMKADSLYTKMAYMYPFLGATANAHSTSGIDPGTASVTITWSGIVTHTTDGIVTTSSAGIGVLGVSPVDVHTSTGVAGIGVYQVSGTVNDQGFAFATTAGSFDADRYQINAPYDGSNVYFKIGDDTNAAYANPGTFSDNFWVGNNIGAAGAIYRNGVSVATNTVAGNLRPENIQFLGANGNAQNMNAVVGFIFGSNGLDATDVSNLNTRVETLMVAAGR